MVPRNLNVAVAEEAADGFDADALHDKVTGKFVSQIMDGYHRNLSTPASALNANQQFVRTRLIALAENVSRITPVLQFQKDCFQLAMHGILKRVEKRRGLTLRVNLQVIRALRL